MKLKPTLLLLILLSSCLFSQSTYDSRRFYFGTKIGYAYQNLSGFNRYTAGWESFTRTKMEPLHGGIQYSVYADYKFFSSPFMLTGLEVNYSDIYSEGSSTFMFWGNQTDIYRKAQLQTLSAFFNLGYGFSLSEKLDISMKTGIGFFKTSIISQSKSRTSESLNGKVTDKGNAFGSRIGLNASYRIIDFMVISSGIAYNSAWIKSFNNSIGKEVWVFDDKEGPKRLDVDLSGFQFQLGLGISI